MTKSEVKNISYNAIPQEDVNYVTVSPFTGDEQCANCLFFNPMHLDMDNRAVPTSCKIIEPYPLAILATGHCERYEASAEPEEDALLVEIKREAQPEAMYITPKPLQDGIADKLMRRNKSRQLFGRAADGMRLGFHITSNGYEDRDHEYVATKALQEYVDACYKKNGDDLEYVGDNKLLFWHDKNLHMGDIIHAEMVKGFLLEISKERDTPIAKRIWDTWEATTEDGSYRWGTSHAFPPLITELIDGKAVYQKIKKLETSVLLWDAASNQLTTSEVIPMAKSKQELFDDIFADIPNAHAMLESEPDKFLALANEQGIEAKEQSDTEAGETIPAPNFTIVVDKLLDQYVEIVEAHADLDERIEAQATVAKERATFEADIEKRVAAAEDFMNDTPVSASQKRLSSVTAKDAKALKEKAGPDEYNPMYPNMKVPLKRGES